MFVTALYSFRLLFVVFHGEERFDEHARHHLKESPAVVTVPLILLAVPSVIIGWITIGPVLFGEFFDDSIFVLAQQDVVGLVGEEFHGAAAFIVHAATQSVALYLAAAGALVAWFLYIRRPDLPVILQSRLAILHRILDNKYYFDWFNENVVAAATRVLAGSLWRVADDGIIDGVCINGSARGVRYLAGVVRTLQTGYLYHYAFAMIIGLTVFVVWLTFGG